MFSSRIGASLFVFLFLSEQETSRGGSQLFSLSLSLPGSARRVLSPLEVLLHVPMEPPAFAEGRCVRRRKRWQSSVAIVFLQSFPARFGTFLSLSSLRDTTREMRRSLAGGNRTAIMHGSPLFSEAMVSMLSPSSLNLVSLLF